MRKNPIFLSVVLFCWLIGGCMQDAVCAQTGFRQMVQLSTSVVEVKKNITNEFAVSSESFEVVSLRNRLGILDEVSTVEVSGQGKFTAISLKGYAFSNKIGEPRLPQRIKLIEVPQKAEVKIQYTRTQYKDIYLDELGFENPLYPVQASISKSAKEAPAFAYNTETYGLNTFGSSEDLVKIEILGESRATRIAKIIISPVQYNPVTNVLRVYTVLDFDVEFENADRKATLDKKVLYQSPAFNSIQNQVVNNMVMKALPINNRSKISKKSETKAIVGEENPMRYVIVADDMFRDSLQPFIKWKTLQGFEVIEAYTSDPAVGKTSKSIQSYLQKLYDNASDLEPAPSFLLLVGDVKQIPPFNSRMKPQYNDHITDLYFAEYTKDILPDVFYGRFSANSVVELMPQIHKTIDMAKADLSKDLFLDTAILIAGDDAPHGYSHLNKQIDYLQTIYFNENNGINCLAYTYPSSSSKTKEIIDNFSNGSSVICYTAHGTEEGWHSPAINIESLDQIQNKGKYPFVIGNCCLTGKFEVNCFGEELLRKKDKGAVVYIGGTNSTYFDEDFYWAIGYSDLLYRPGLPASKIYTYENTELGSFDCFFHTHGESFDKWARCAGEIMTAGNIAVLRANSAVADYYWEVYQLFGDPSYMPYKARPQVAKAVYEDHLYINDTIFNIETDPFAQVAISKGTVIFGVATADSLGRAKVSLIGLDDIDTVNLCITNQFRATFIDTLNVKPPFDKYVQMSTKTTMPSSAEPIHNFIYGEDYDVYITLRNIGKQVINKATVQLISDSPYFNSISKEYKIEESIGLLEEVVLSEPLSFHVSADAPNGNTIPYKIRVVMDEDLIKKADKKQRFSAKSPVFKLESFAVNDTAGILPNGVLDNEETVKGRVRITNIGGTMASGVNMQIRSDREYYLNLPTAKQSIGDMAVGQTVDVVFDYSAKKAGAYYDIYTLFFDLETKGHKAELSTQSYISPVFETFETADFSFVNWDTLSSDWTISTAEYYEGKYSASSASISNKDTSSLTITVDALMDDEVGFYYKTSTELVNNSYGDFLRFYIDGVLLGSWAGENAWSQVSFPVSAGIHTFTWSYVKDEMDNQGHDKVWIDKIRLPIGSKPPINPLDNEMEEKISSEEPIIRLFDQLYSGSLSLKFNLPANVQGSLYLVNALGQRVQTLSPSLSLDAGVSTRRFDISKLNPGLYVCVFEISSRAGNTNNSASTIPTVNSLKIIIGN